MKFKKLKSFIASAMVITTMLTNSIVYAANAATTDATSSIKNATSIDTSLYENVLKVDMDDNGSINYTVPQSTTGLEDKEFSWDNALVYFVITDRFVNGDKSNDHSYGRSTTEVDADKYETRQGTFHGGDLKGLTKKLNEGYFTDLGINAIWITAPYEQIHGAVCGNGFKHYAYHGYYALDFSNMDANMGTEEDLETFIDTAHENGIRVIFDVVMNHAGYADAYTANEYGFGKLSSNWKEIYFNTPESQYTWDMDYTGGTDEAGRTPGMMEYSGDWNTNYWGTDWIRLHGGRFSGNDGVEGNSLTALSGGLPDFKTENTNSVGLPAILKNKWQKEGRYEKETAELDAYFSRTGKTRTVTQYIVKWLTDWVREYGVDGFRCDTAKHVEQNVWKQLKDEASIALKTWRQNNPDKPGAQWTDDFWMTGEHYDWSMGNVTNDSYFSNGFDSMINFDYQGCAFTSGSSLVSLHQKYADKINSCDNNVLSYISSHDKGLSRGNMIAAGTSLVLAPGGVQIYYGDETSRPASVSGEQGWRSQMNFGSEDTKVLAHWQKLGQFRNNHLAVGAGKQVTLDSTTMGRTYEKDGVTDKVVIAVPGTGGSKSIPVGTIFQDGETIRDAYTGEEYIVSGGSVTVNVNSNGVALLETTGKVEPFVGISPKSQEFYSETLTVTLSCKDTSSATYTRDGGKAVSFENGEKITIGSELAIGESTTITVNGKDTNGNTLESKTATYTRIAEPDGIKVHVKNDSWSGTPNIYVYTGSGTTAQKIEGAWPGKAMTAEGDGWYVYETKEVLEARVIFNGSFGQYPVQDAEGLLVSGEVWYYNNQEIDNPNKPETGKVTVKYVDEDGNSIASSTTTTGKVGDSYTTTAKSIGGYTLKTTPSNASGKYTKADITVTYVYKQNSIDDPLKITSTTTSVSSPQNVGTAIKLTTNASGGTGTKQYRFVVMKSGSTTYTRDYQTSNTATWTPTVAGTYTIYFKVKDGSTEVQSSKTFVINSANLTISSATTNVSSPQTKGTAIKLTTNASGGTGTKNYRFVVMKNGSTTYARDYQTSNTATWTPTATGTYTIYFKVKDGSGKEVQVSKTFVINEALAVSSAKTNVASPQGVNTSITLTTSATGGTGTKQYRFVAMKGNTVTFSRDYQTGNTATWKPTATGTYTLYFKVKDGSGKEVQKSMNYVINDTVKVSSYKASVASPQEVGTGITLSMAATGGTGTKNYRFVVMKNSIVTYSKGYSTSATTTWTPSEAGNYVIYFKVKDGNGKETQATMNYVVKEVAGVKITTLTTNKISPVTVGTEVTISAKAISKKAISYKYWVYEVGNQWTLIKNFTNSTSATWTPKTSGKYVIWVDAKDADGNTDSKSIEFVVNDKVTTIQETNSKITFEGTWTSIGSDNYSGGSIKLAKSTGATAKFKFTGTGLSLLTTAANDKGVAEVIIDGKVYAADNYNSSIKYKSEVFKITNLSSGTHTVTIKYSGLKSSNSKGTGIGIDAINIFNGNIV